MRGGDLVFHPLTADRWVDLEQLFGPERGATSGCWCQWTRISRPEWDALGRTGRKQRFEAEVREGPPPGLLAYDGGTAVGWCAVAPRAATPKLNRSRIAAPAEADIDAVWAITCFYIASSHRRSGLMRPLIEAAVAHAFAHGARAIEACPIEPQRNLIWGEGFVGIASAFGELGFAEVARRSPTRPLMRLARPSRTLPDRSGSKRSRGSGRR